MEDRIRGPRPVIPTADLPAAKSVLRLEIGGRQLLALWRGGLLFDLSPLTLDELLAVPATEMRARLEEVGQGLQVAPAAATLLAPAGTQEVWASGVTYLRSREARMEESSEKDVYQRVYQAARPE